MLWHHLLIKQVCYHLNFLFLLVMSWLSSPSSFDFRDSVTLISSPLLAINLVFLPYLFPSIFFTAMLISSHTFIFAFFGLGLWDLSALELYIILTWGALDSLCFATLFDGFVFYFLGGPLPTTESSSETKSTKSSSVAELLALGGLNPALLKSWSSVILISLVPGGEGLSQTWLQGLGVEVEQGVASSTSMLAMSACLNWAVQLMCCCLATLRFTLAVALALCSSSTSVAVWQRPYSYPATCIRATTIFLGRGDEAHDVALKSHSCLCYWQQNTVQNAAQKETSPCGHLGIWSCSIHQRHQGWKAWCMHQGWTICWLWFRVQGLSDILATKTLCHCQAQCHIQQEQCNHKWQHPHYCRWCSVWGGDG